MSVECTHLFPERGVGCKACEAYFAHADKLENDPREMERQERLWQDIEMTTLRAELEQAREALRRASAWFVGYASNGGQGADEEIAIIDTALAACGEELEL